MKLTTSTFIIALLLLSGCGIKPAALSPPDPESNYFPRVYPDPSIETHNPARQVPR